NAEGRRPVAGPAGALVGQTRVVYFLVFRRQRRRACQLAPVIRRAGAFPLTFEVRILAEIAHLRDRRCRQQARLPAQLRTWRPDNAWQFSVGYLTAPATPCFEPAQTRPG